jgi:hypothetical protein
MGRKWSYTRKHQRPSFVKRSTRKYSLGYRLSKPLRPRKVGGGVPKLGGLFRRRRRSKAVGCAIFLALPVGLGLVAAWLVS